TARHVEPRLFACCRAPSTPLDPSASEDVRCRHLLGNANRMAESVWHQRDTEPESNLIGDLRERPDDYLRSCAMRASFAEVVLDKPRRAEAELVGEFHLLNRALEFRSFGFPQSVFPRFGHGELVQKVQLHRCNLSRWLASAPYG